MHPDLESFYLRQSEPNKSCLLALRSIILAADTQVNETRKYGMPCFCYGRKMFCYLWIDKTTNKPYILMVDGNYLNHDFLEKGDRSRMKIFRIDPEKNLPIRKIKLVLGDALKLYKAGGKPGRS
jgi:hypothetical protein